MVDIDYDTTAFIKDLLERFLNEKNRLLIDQQFDIHNIVVARIMRAFIKRVESVSFMEDYVCTARKTYKRPGKIPLWDAMREDLLCYDRLKRYELKEQVRLENQRAYQKKNDEKRRKERDEEKELQSNSG